VGHFRKESFIILCLECHEWSACAHLRLFCAVGHTATFAVNAALVALTAPRVKLSLAPIHEVWVGRKYRFSSRRYDPTEIRTSFSDARFIPLNNLNGADC